MQFLDQAPVVKLVEEAAACSRFTTFFGKFSEVRPKFEDILARSDWSKELQRSVERAVRKEKKIGTVGSGASRVEISQMVQTSLAFVGVYIDGHGGFVLLQFVQPEQTSNAKKHVRKALEAFPAPQRQLIEQTLHPCDELDKHRIKEMTAIIECRPQGLAPEKQKKPKPAPASAEPRPMAELLAEQYSDSESERDGHEEQVAQRQASGAVPPMSLQDFAAPASSTL